LLPKQVIKHINNKNWDNRKENLKRLTNKERSKNFGKYLKPTRKNTRCVRCKSKKTKINKLGTPRWYKRKDGYVCEKCQYTEYNNEVRLKHRRIYERYYNVCLLPKTELNYINGDKTDKRIENLKPAVRGYTGNLVQRDIKRTKEQYESIDFLQRVKKVIVLSSK
jgi:superfamily II helicase